jgi:hypothetical protein
MALLLSADSFWPRVSPTGSSWAERHHMVCCVAASSSCFFRAWNKTPHIKNMLIVFFYYTTSELNKKCDLFSYREL